MDTYVITAEDEDNSFSTGVLLSVEEANNPEDAMNQLAKKAIDDEFLDHVDDIEDSNFSVESRVNLALWLIDEMAGEEKEIKIYTVARDEYRQPAILTVDELEFIDHPQQTSQQ